MNKFRRVFSMMMVLCLLLVLPQLVHAAETEAEQSYATQVNPLFEEVVAEEDLLPLGEAAEGTDYVTEWETVVAALRKAMVDRQETVTLHYQTANPEDMGRELMVKLVNAAVEHTGVGNEGDYLAHQYAGWNGCVSGHTDEAYTYLDITYTITYFTTAEQEQVVTEQLQSIFDALKLGDTFYSNYESVRTIYDYICQNIALAQDGSDLKNTAYGALTNQSATSRGYALLLYRMLLDSGIDCRVVSGTLDGNSHVWNIVNIYDRFISPGVEGYFNMDASQDTGKNQYAHFLLCDDSFSAYQRSEACDTETFHAAHPMHAEDYLLAGKYAYRLKWTLDEMGNMNVLFDENVYESDNRLARHKLRVITLTADESVGTGLEGRCNLPDLKGFDNLEKITLHDKVESFGLHQFSYLPALKEINIPAALKKIDSSAFAGCVSLETFTLPATLEDLGACPFNRCSSLTGIWVDENNPYFTSDEKGVLYNKDKTILIEAPAKLEGDYVVPDTVTAIEWGAFLGCKDLTGIELPNTIQYINSQTFYQCTALTEIQIPASVSSLELWAFSGCTGLKTIKFMGCAPFIGDSVFEDVEATAYYPAGNSTWTEDRLQDYNGDLTWVAYEHSHEFESVITPATCYKGGYTTYTCVSCGDSYVADETPVASHRWSEGSCEVPRRCTVCGKPSDEVHGHIYDSKVDGTCAFCDVPRQDVEYREVVHMFRMYNPNTGEHFYTGSEVERDNLIEEGWQYEGVGFTFPANTGAPVHRLFHEPTGEHLYTMDESEKDRLIAEGWNYEGVAFNSAYDTEAVQHRLHNPNADVGAYHFTFSLEEKDNLIAAGWEYQGIGWYSCWK